MSAACLRRLAVRAFALALLFVFALVAAWAPQLPAAYADDLSLMQSAVEDGAKNVPVKGELWLEFNHNVAAVEENAACVTLQTAKGKSVPKSCYKVVLPDAEIEFGLRKCVLVKLKGLEYSTGYRIHVEGALAAKNGASLGSDVDIEFTTVAKGKKAAALADAPQSDAGSGNGNGDGSGGSASGSSAGSAGGAGSQSADGTVTVPDQSMGSQTSADEENTEATPVVAVVAAVVTVLVIVVALVMRVRKAKANAPIKR